MSLPAENVRQIEPQALVTMTPMDMLARAVQSGADLDMIEKLMNLQERWEASNARKAFDEAVAAAKADIPVILKNATSHNNKYADFAAIARAVDPFLVKARHPLPLPHRTDRQIYLGYVRPYPQGRSQPRKIHSRPSRCHRGEKPHPGDRLDADLFAAVFAGAGSRACCVK
jgi:hypothetical protein